MVDVTGSISSEDINLDRFWKGDSNQYVSLASGTLTLAFTDNRDNEDIQ